MIMRFFGPSETERLVRKLQDSELFADDLPKRKRYTHTEWAGLEDYQRGQASYQQLLAIQRMNNFRELAKTVDELADPKHNSAVPILAQLWSECAVEPIRTAAGHTLLGIGTPEARAALIDLIEDADPFSALMAARAILNEDPSKFFDRCAVYFTPEKMAQPGGEVIPNAILELFVPGEGATLHWIDPKIPECIQTDKRWVDLFVKFRKDKELGFTAKQAIEFIDPNLVKESMKKTSAKETPQVIKTITMGSGDLLKRYQQGQHEEVWRELRSYESVDGVLLEETMAVANETMKRVAHNADLLAERLANRGWKALFGSLRTPPQPEDIEMIERIEEFTGERLPVSLRAFWEIVGGIDFIWDYESGEPPDLGDDLVMEDPLCVLGPQICVEEIEDFELDPDDGEPLSVTLAPDHLHKANISGGEPYAIILPFKGVDPIFANERHRLPFVDYLRLCFKFGGFPRLEHHPDRTPGTRRFLIEMTKDLEPFLGHTLGHEDKVFLTVSQMCSARSEAVEIVSTIESSTKPSDRVTNVPQFDSHLRKRQSYNSIKSN
jgi:hypothetical protein